MAEHEKAFLVCENKSFVEGLTKEEYEADISLKYPIAVHKEIGRFTKDDHEYKVMHYCSGELDLSDFQYSNGVYSKDISDTLSWGDISNLGLIDCYVNIYFKDDRDRGGTMYAKKIPAQLYFYGQLGLDTFELRFNHEQFSGQGRVTCKITIHVEYIKY